MSKQNINSSIELLIIEHIRQIYKNSTASLLSKGKFYDLSYGKTQALKTIEDNKKTMSEIAKSLQITMPTATVIVNKLVNTQLVKRIVDKKDRRKIEIEITSKGKKILNASEKAKSRQIGKFLSNLSESDMKTLARILKKINSNSK